MKSWYFERDCPFCTRSGSSFCRNPLNFPVHFVGEIMIPCQLSTFSEFICSAFQFQGLIAKKSVNAWKITNEVRKGWKLMMWLWIVHFWTQKNYGVQISSKKWNPFVTDEFPCETLILWMRLSVLYTKCIQFLP